MILSFPRGRCFWSSARSLAGLISVLVGGGLASPSADAFPELVRHGYPNCITCHVSPNGGGTLTQYGRSLSQEILSTWGTKNETRWMYFAKSPDWLNLGGDVRSVQTWKDTATEKSGAFIFMQADAEAAVSLGPVTVDASLGKNYFPPNDTTPHSFVNNFLSRRHYAIFRPAENFNIRAGKFMQAFGINTPDHILVTKRGLGWDEGSETYNVEGSYIGEHADFFLTGNFGHLDNTSEKGVAVRGSYTFRDTLKVGGSYFFGASTTNRRHVYGPYGILGFTPHFFLLTEADLQNNMPKATNAPSTFGWVNYNRLDYEWVQGFHTYVTAEFSKLDFSNPLTQGNAYGAGIQFFPRPHFEFQLVYQRRRDMGVGDFYDYGYLLLHFYP